MIVLVDCLECLDCRGDNGARRVIGPERPNSLDCRKCQLRGKDGLSFVEGVSSSEDEDASSSDSLIIEIHLLVGLLLASGAAKVSAPIEGLERNVLRRKLLSLDRLLEPPLGLVGVGGKSSALDWLSVIRLAVGDWVSGCASSSLSTLRILRKLPRRWRELPVLPNMFEFLPRLSTENFETFALNGVLGVPNWCCGRADSPNRLPLRFTKGVSIGARSATAGGNDWRFDGVSGITYIPAPAAGSSTFRFFFDRRPVEKAMGGC